MLFSLFACFCSFEGKSKGKNVVRKSSSKATSKTLLLVTKEGQMLDHYSQQEAQKFCDVLVWKTSPLSRRQIQVDKYLDAPNTIKDDENFNKLRKCGLFI